MKVGRYIWLPVTSLLAAVVLVSPSFGQQGESEEPSTGEPNVEAVGGTSLGESAPGGEQTSAETSDSSDQAAADDSEDDADDDNEEESSFDAQAHFRRAAGAVNRGSYDVAIRLYEKILEEAPGEHPRAHYNLGSVYQAKRELSDALFHFQAYLHSGDDPGTTEKARRGVERAIAQGWNKRVAQLSVDIEPESGSAIYINGYLFATGTDLEEIRLHSGDYKIRGTATDYLETEPRTVSLEMQGEASVELRPKRKIFTGKVRVSVNQQDAQVRLKPRSLATERAEQETIQTTTPMSEPVELVTGKYLLEVTKDDYHRWVRYIDVERDETEQVDVKMSRKLPEEIR